MQHAALARGHGTEAIRLSGLHDALGRDAGCHLQFLEPQRLVVHAVEADLFVLFRFQMEHAHGHVFQGTQQFAAALEEQRTVGPGEVHHDLGMLPVAVLAPGRVDHDAIAQAEAAVGHQALKELFDLAGGCDLVGLAESDPSIVVICELKLSFNLELILQAVDRAAIGDEIWIAARVSAKGRGREADRRFRDLCRRHCVRRRRQTARGDGGGEHAVGSADWSNAVWPDRRT